MSKRDDGESVAQYIEHPLFPLDEGMKSFEVAYISMARKEGGAMVWVPQMFRAEEMTTTDQILERFGGGTYELYARAQSKSKQGEPGNITKRRLISLPGKPKPLDPSNPTMQEEIAAGLRPNPFDAAKPSTGALTGDSAVLIAIMQMGQQSAQAQAQQSQQFMALMMQMMSEGKKEAAESSRMMMQMFTQMTTAQQQSMMQMLPLLVGGRGGGPEEIGKYVELFKTMGFTRADGVPVKTDEDSEVSVSEVLSNVAHIVQGAPAALSALREMGPGNGQVALPVGTEAAPGSAASVLQGRG